MTTLNPNRGIEEDKNELIELIDDFDPLVADEVTKKKLIAEVRAKGVHNIENSEKLADMIDAQEKLYTEEMADLDALLNGVKKGVEDAGVLSPERKRILEEASAVLDDVANGYKTAVNRVERSFLGAEEGKATSKEKVEIDKLKSKLNQKNSEEGSMSTSA